jgi:hypothetical protein
MSVASEVKNLRKEAQELTEKAREIESSEIESFLKENKKKISKLILQVANKPKYKNCFLKGHLRTIVATKNRFVGLTFLMKKEYSRSWNLYLFEDIVKKIASDIVKNMKKHGITNIKYHSASSCDLEFVVDSL